jgi:hypothetical protein
MFARGVMIMRRRRRVLRRVPRRVTRMRGWVKKL